MCYLCKPIRSVCSAISRHRHRPLREGIRRAATVMRCTSNISICRAGYSKTQDRAEETKHGRAESTGKVREREKDKEREKQHGEVD